MGAGESKLRDDAGLADQSMTVDGAEPTIATSSFTVAKANAVTDREYEMTSPELVLSSKAFDDLTLGFDILSHKDTSTPDIYASAIQNDGLDEDGAPMTVARVAADESHRTWTVYWIDKPTYPSQAAEDIAASANKLYKRMEIQVSEGRYSATVKTYGVHSSPKEDTGVLGSEPILKLEKPIGISELFATHYYTLLPGEDKEKSNPIAAWKWANPLAQSMDLAVAKGADLTLHFILLVIMNIVHRDQVIKAGGE